MAAADQVIALVDRHAAALLADLRMVGQAIEGAHHQVYQQTPSLRGLQLFLAQVRSLPESASRLTSSALSAFQDETLSLRTAFDPASPANPDTLSLASQQVQQTIGSLTLIAARAFRAQVASRTSIVAPRGSLRLLNRAGHRVQADDVFLLTGRKAMLDLFNEAQLSGLAAEGATQAQIYHAFPDHESNGLVFPIEEYPDHAQLFHPRSGAVIGRVA